MRSNWASGQDQARSLKQLMQALVPGLKVWLDVDDGNRSTQEQKSSRPPPTTLTEKYKRAIEIVDSVVVLVLAVTLSTRVHITPCISLVAGTLIFS